MKRFLHFVFFAFTLVSCIIQPVSSECESGAQDGEMSVIRISVAFDPMTRSSVVSDEDAIHDVGIFSFERGAFVAGAFYECPSGIPDDMELNLPSGRSYNIYVLANAGMAGCPDDEDAMEEYAISLGSLSELDGRLPMAWKGSLDVIVGDYGLDVDLAPLVAKVRFGIDDRLIGGLEVISVRLRQGALVVRPFAGEGSRAEASGEVSDGDWASEADLKTLNEGGSISLYALENCQGRLLAGNVDPWDKVPDNIPGELASLCTYLEVKCSFPEKAEYGAFQGDVTYRIYLGEDAVADFNVRRNSVQKISLIPTEDGLGNVSWRVDTSGLCRYGGVVEGGFPDENFHKVDDFYLTERILFRYKFDDAARKFWSERDYTLAGLDANGRLLVSFTDYGEKDPGVWECIGTCMKQGAFDVWLVDADGVLVSRLTEGCMVKMPSLIFGNGSRYAGDLKVLQMQTRPELRINGDASVHYAYLVDENGCNINQSLGCDVAQLDAILHTGSLEDCLTVAYAAGTCGDGGPAMKMSVSCSNDGRDSVTNRMLCGVLGSGPKELELQERFTGLSAALSCEVTAYDISINVVQTPASLSYLGTEYMYRVENKSCLPFYVKGWRSIHADYNGSASDYENASETADGTMCLRKMYGSFMEDHDVPLYLSYMPETQCSFEDASGAVYGNSVCFPADDGGIRKSDAYNAVSADRRTAADGSFMYPRPVSLSHSLVVGMLYDCPEPPEFTGDVVSDDGRRMITVDMNFDDEYGLVATASEDVSLKIRTYGVLKSHIRTLKGSDWFFGIGTSCKYYRHEHEFDSGYVSVELSDMPSVVDAYVVKNAFEYIRTIEYYSHYDTVDRREVLKPYAFFLGVDLEVDDDICIAVSFPDEIVYDYQNINVRHENRVSEPPSTWSHKCNGSPAGSVFLDEEVTMGFTVTSGIDTGITLIAAR